jgi:hypothetical protein
MVKVRKSKDCGNSPKNLLVQSLAIAIEKGDPAGFSACVGDEVLWSYPGCPVARGVAEASSRLHDQRTRMPVEIEHAISHGRSGAAHGAVKFASGAEVRFCHFMEFTSIRGDRIGRISSFYKDCLPGRILPVGEGRAASAR